MQRTLAFLAGVRDFNRAFTLRYIDYDLQRAYDWGREIAHRLTLRHFDN